MSEPDLFGDTDTQSYPDEEDTQTVVSRVMAKLARVPGEEGRNLEILALRTLVYDLAAAWDERRLPVPLYWYSDGSLNFPLSPRTHQRPRSPAALPVSRRAPRTESSAASVAAVGSDSPPYGGLFSATSELPTVESCTQCGQRQVDD